MIILNIRRLCCYLKIKSGIFNLSVFIRQLNQIYRIFVSFLVFKSDISLFWYNDIFFMFMYESLYLHFPLNLIINIISRKGMSSLFHKLIYLRNRKLKINMWYFCLFLRIHKLLFDKSFNISSQVAHIPIIHIWNSVIRKHLFFVVVIVFFLNIIHKGIISDCCCLLVPLFKASFCLNSETWD